MHHKVSLRTFGNIKWNISHIMTIIGDAVIEKSALCCCCLHPRVWNSAEMPVLDYSGGIRICTCSLASALCLRVQWGADVKAVPGQG